MERLVKLLTTGSQELGIELNREQVEKFLIYLKELTEWNKKVNLTAITGPAEIVTKHFLDSLTLLALPYFDTPNLSVVDVGTGAGFPGIPLKIVRPDLGLCLLEATRKKTKFLEHLVSHLRFAEVEIVWARAEDFGRGAGREKFNLALSRAVAKLPELAKVCLPLVRLNGYLIAQKSASVNQEIAETERRIPSLGGQVEECRKVRLPGTDIVRTLVVIKKINP